MCLGWCISSKLPRIDNSRIQWTKLLEKLCNVSSDLEQFYLNIKLKFN